jgi:hypothetical protein
VRLKTRIVLRRILVLLAVVAVSLWIGSYWFPFRLGLFALGDAGFFLVSKDGAVGIAEVVGPNSSSPGMINIYWHVLAVLAIAFAITYCGRITHDRADAARSFPVIGAPEEQPPEKTG